MRIEELKWVVRLFETRNLTKASESLYITQPALTQCLKRIEDELGFPLFTRSNKGLEATEKGLLFEKTARSITDTYSDFQVSVKLLDQDGIKKIAIGLPPFLSTCCSADIVRKLTISCPGIEFSIHESSFEQRLEMLHSGEIQIGVATGPIELPGIKSHNFGNGRFVILLKKGSPVAEHIYEENGVQYLDPRFLADEPLAVTKQGQASRRIINNLMVEAGINADVKHESHQVDTLYNFARNGIVSAIAPMLSKMNDLELKEVHVCLIPDSYRWGKYCFCCLALNGVDRLIPPAVFSIIENTVLDNNTFKSMR